MNISTLILKTKWSLLCSIIFVSSLVNSNIPVAFAYSSTAALGLPSTLTVAQNSNFSVPITLDTHGTEIISVDILLTFDPAKIELISISPTSKSSGNLKLFLPSDSLGNLNNAQVVSAANTSGKIDFSVVAFDLPNQRPLAGFNGAVQLALLNFKARSILGSSSITFNMSANNTTDSNIIINNGGVMVDVLTQVSQITNLTNLIITNSSVLIGDANTDGIIDLVDFSIWKKEYLGQVLTKSADFNHSGLVDLVDFGIWKSAYLGRP